LAAGRGRTKAQTTDGKRPGKTGGAALCLAGTALRRRGILLGAANSALSRSGETTLSDIRPGSAPATLDGPAPFAEEEGSRGLRALTIGSAERTGRDPGLQAAAICHTAAIPTIFRDGYPIHRRGRETVALALRHFQPNAAP
jgi:hypothetical protein